MLTIEILNNKENLNYPYQGDYTVQVKINGVVIEETKIKNFERASGWLSLAKLAIQNCEYEHYKKLAKDV